MMSKNQDYRILIVDDVQKNIQVLGTVLRNEGFLTNVAQNGKQALDIVSKVKPDLILLDIMMPELDGFETCQRLKAQAETQNIPVIFLTAKTEIDDMVHGFELGAVDYITKPFNPTELLVRVQTHLKLYHLQEALRHQVDENARMKREQEAFLRHELKNNLMPIQGYADLLNRVLVLDDDHKEWCRAIVSGTEKIVALIDALRKLQDLESNTAVLNRAFVNVQDMIQPVIDDLVFAFDQRVDVVFKHPEQPVVVEVDDILLRGVFQNLIKNACEHVVDLDEKQRVVSVELSEDAKWVTVAIHNLGPAISPDRVATFFDKFNTQNKQGGTGLGTTYAFWVTRAHGGHISVTSTDELGTTIVLQLPASQFEA